MADRHDQTEKQDRLRKAGTLNRTPENVSDPMFAAGDFFDARDLLQVRYEMVRLVRIGQATVRTKKVLVRSAATLKPKPRRSLSKTVRRRLRDCCSLKVRRSVRSLMVRWMRMCDLPCLFPWVPPVPREQRRRLRGENAARAAGRGGRSGPA